MIFRYTARRGIHDPRPVAAFDHQGVSSYWKSPLVMDRADEFSLTFSFNIQLLDVTAQHIFFADNFVWVGFDTAANNGQLMIYNQAQGLPYTFPAIVPDIGQDQLMTISWDGAGNLTVDVDGALAVPTPWLTFTADVRAWSLGDWSGGGNIHAAIWDAVFSEGGFVTRLWDIDEGEGNFAYDTLGGWAWEHGGIGGEWIYRNAPHVSGQQYVVTTPMTKYDRSIRSIKKTSIAIGGDRQDTFQRQDEFYTFQTVPMRQPEAGDFREFMDSITDGAWFELDDELNPLATVYKQFQIEGTSYTERRAIRKGDGGYNDYFVFGFKAREV